MESNRSITFDDTQVAFSTKSSAALRKAYFLFLFMNWDKFANIGIFFIKYAIKIGLPIKWIIRKTIFQQFCGGETVHECKPAMDTMRHQGVSTILDYAVEGEHSEDQFESNAHFLKKLIVLDFKNEEIAFSVLKMSSLVQTSLMEKIQNGTTLTSAEEEDWKKFGKRINDIFYTASRQGIKLLIDAEESWVQHTIDKLALGGMIAHNDPDAIVYNTYQMYLKGKLAQLKVDIARAKNAGHILGVKLVRGAYMEKERDRAQAQSYNSPICERKEITDKQYNDALKYCIENINTVSLCCGTHNEHSNYFLINLLQEYGVEPSDRRIFFAQLYGMSDHITFNLAKAKYCVAKYLPFGPIESVMPYLFRRAQENKSVSGQAGRELLLIKKEMDRRKIKSV